MTFSCRRNTSIGPAIAFLLSGLTGTDIMKPTHRFMRCAIEIVDRHKMGLCCALVVALALHCLVPLGPSQVRASRLSLIETEIRAGNLCAWTDSAGWMRDGRLTESEQAAVRRARREYASRHDG